MSSELLEKEKAKLHRVDENRIEAFRYLENERKKITGILLHDIAQMLFAAKIKLSKNDTGDLSNHIGTAIKTIRSLVLDLNLEILERFGLMEAISELIRASKTGKTDYCFVNLETLPKDLSSTMETAIFRVIQIILNHHLETFKYACLTINRKEHAIHIAAKLKSNEPEDSVAFATKNMLSHLSPVVSMLKWGIDGKAML